MDHHMIGVVIAVIVVIGVIAFAIWAVYNSINSDKEEKLALIEARNRERLALIDKGMDPSLADNKKFSRPAYNALMWGLLLGGFSAGLFIGYLVYLGVGGDKHFLVHAMGMLCGGIGLLIYYFIRRKTESK